MSLIQRENKVGISKGATWGTLVDPFNGTGLYVKAHTPPKGARKIVTNEDEFGRGMASEGQVLEYEAQSGSMSCRLYHEGLEHLMASMMGAYAGSEEEAGITYQHKFVLEPVASGLFHSVAWEEGDEIKAVNSATIVSGTFGYADGLNLDVNYLGDIVSVSGLASPLGVSYPSEGKGIFKLSQASVKINDAGDEAFGGGHTFYPSGIDIAVTRGFEGLPVVAGSDTIIEPIEKTAPTVEVTLTFPKKETSTATFLTAFTSRTYKKMQISYVGDDVTGTLTNQKYQVEFNFPKMFIMEAPDFAADSPIPTTIKLKALLASAAPSGIMDYMVPYVVLQNGLANTAFTAAYPAPSAAITA
ncbi:MAG: hypothetical protein GY950_30975 [bacterium]|nr:hypothetical protein [bacterium]